MATAEQFKPAETAVQSEQFTSPPINAKGRSSNPSKEAAHEIAEKLMLAASSGENLMKEIDFLSNPSPGQPSKIAVLREMVDLQAEKQFGTVEIIDEQGKPITDSRGVFSIGKIVAKTGNREVPIYQSGVEEDARALYNQDRHNLLVDDKVEPEHKEDTRKIIAGFQKAVDDMVKSGHRIDGEGAVMGLLNNIDRAYFDDQKYDCVDQSITVLSALKKLQLDGHYDFHLVGDPPHYTVEVVSHNANDPIIHLDPWRGRNAIEIKPPGQGTPDQRLNAWPDAQGRLHWS